MVAFCGQSRELYIVSLRASRGAPVHSHMASLATLVASLASSVERTTVRGSAISGDVTELAASVALHSLSLAYIDRLVSAP